VVAFRVDEDEPVLAVLDLAAEQEARLEIGFAAFAPLLLLKADIAEIVRRFGEAADGVERDPLLLADVGLECGHDALACGEIAGGEDGELPLAIDAVAEHLAVGGNLVDSRVGQRIRAEHHAGFQRSRHTVGHNAVPFQARNRIIPDPWAFGLLGFESPPGGRHWSGRLLD